MQLYSTTCDISPHYVSCCLKTQHIHSSSLSRCLLSFSVWLSACLLSWRQLSLNLIRTSWHLVTTPSHPALLRLGKTSKDYKNEFFWHNLSATRKSISKNYLDSWIKWKTTWLHHYLDVLIMEYPLARLHKASAATVLNIVEFINWVYWWVCSWLLKFEYDLGATANYS